MGQQQLLLLVLCVVVVGLATMMGFAALDEGMQKDTYGQISSEAVRIAGEASAWRLKPGSTGGGEAPYLTGLSFATLGYPSTGSDPRDSETGMLTRSIRDEHTAVPRILVKSIQRPDLRVELSMYGLQAECLVMRRQRRIGNDWTGGPIPPRPAGCDGWTGFGPGSPGGVINPTDPPPQP